MGARSTAAWCSTRCSSSPLFGVLSYTKLGQSEDPPFTFKVMVIRTGWPGATARQVEEQITDKIEKKLQEAPNVDVIQSYSKPGESLVFFRMKDSAPPSDGAGDLVPGAEENRRHPQHPAGRHHRPVVQRRVRRRLRQHLRAHRRRLLLRRPQEVRRPHPVRAPARPRRRQGRVLRRAGREGLHRAVEHPARDARRRRRDDRERARHPERDRPRRGVRDAERQDLPPHHRRLRLGRRGPRDDHPRQRAALPPRRHRARAARLCRPAAAEDAVPGPGGVRHRRRDGQGRRHHRARGEPRPRGRPAAQASFRSASSSRR